MYFWAAIWYAMKCVSHNLRCATCKWFQFISHAYKKIYYSINNIIVCYIWQKTWINKQKKMRKTKRKKNILCEIIFYRDLTCNVFVIVFRLRVTHNEICLKKKLLRCIEIVWYLQFNFTVIILESKWASLNYLCLDEL